ncbi:MAG: rRNA maturation RNase YbeY [Treponema sp.]|jgi:probable rRNA maturation factor|nr:rRNA maturation RNase YbeY [Treponema sp.]
MKNNVFVSMQEECEPPSWFEKVEPFVLEILEKLELNHWELSVMFCKDSFIHELNKQYRKIDSPTDVLSFEQGGEYKDEEGISWFTAGDIVISLDTLGYNCKKFNVSFDDELKRLLVHGILHLKGMDHADNSPEREMLIFQEEFLKNLNYPQIIVDSIWDSK